MRVTVWVEKMTNGELWGRTSTVGSTFVTGYGETMELLLANIRRSMVSFQEKEGGAHEGWCDLDLSCIEFEVKLKTP